MRGKRRQWPGYRQKWKSSQGPARPSSPCRDLLPANGEKEAVIPEAAGYRGPIGRMRKQTTGQQEPATTFFSNRQRKRREAPNATQNQKIAGEDRRQ